MTSLLSAFLLAVVLTLLAAVAVIDVEILLACLPPRARKAAVAPRKRVAVLVPAYNEANSIRDTLENVQAQLRENDRLLVVADNCTDDTASVATRCGAEALVRSDAQRRGKGFALDFGVRYLRTNPPDVLIVADADCKFDHGAIDRLASLATSAERPVQSLYLMKSSPDADFRKQIAEFAWLVKNQVRPLGMQRLGLPCHLTGTGMAFPWEIIRTADLANANLAEDMKLGLELARQGKGPIFCPDALVTSMFPNDANAQRSQRTRWEHGHLGIILSEFPGLLRDSLLHHDLALFSLALDLAVPPLALLTLLLVGGLSLAAVGAFLGAGFLSFFLAATAGALYISGVLLAWSRFGRSVLPLSTLVRAPIYVLGKIPMYLRFLYRRQESWVRTARDKRNR